MKIKSIRVIPFRIPNHKVHQIATLKLSAIENVLVCIETESGHIGVGEAVSEAKWNANVLEAHEVLLRKYLSPPLIGMNPFDINTIWRAMDTAVNGQLSAKAAIDIALYDLMGQILQMPVWRILGGALRSSIPVEGPGFGIGFMKPQEAADFAMEAVKEGCMQIEIKCGHPEGWQWDLDVIEAVRSACGREVSFKVDITEAYSYKTALHVLPKMAELGVVWAEQPLPRHQVKDLARLRQHVPIGIMIEESIGDSGDLLNLLSLGLADAIHVKMAMLGGITKARRMIDICYTAGIGVQSGTSTSSGVGLAAAHQLAFTAPSLVRGSHASPLARAVDDILKDPLPPFPVEVKALDKPGLGIEVDWDKVEKYKAPLR